MRAQEPIQAPSSEALSLSTWELGPLRGGSGHGGPRPLASQRLTHAALGGWDLPPVSTVHARPVCPHLLGQQTSGLLTVGRPADVPSAAASGRGPRGLVVSWSRRRAFGSQRTQGVSTGAVGRSGPKAGSVTRARASSPVDATW